MPTYYELHRDECLQSAKEYYKMNKTKFMSYDKRKERSIYNRNYYLENRKRIQDNFSRRYYANKRKSITHQEGFADSKTEQQIEREKEKLKKQLTKIKNKNKRNKVRNAKEVGKIAIYFD